MAGNPWDHRWKTEGKRLGKGGQSLTELVTSIADPNVFGALKILKNNKSGIQARLRMPRLEVVNLEILAPMGAMMFHAYSTTTPTGSTIYRPAAIRRH